MRIRSIKPEFWRDETIVSLPISARLTFIGLWSYVDDNGVGDARVSSIVGDLYAEDMARDPQETLRRVSGDLRELEEERLIVTYRDPNQPRRTLIYVRNWKRHQVVNKPSKGNQYPLPSAETLERSVPPETIRTPSGDPPETLRAGAGEQGNRGTGETPSPLRTQVTTRANASESKAVARMHELNSTSISSAALAVADGYRGWVGNGIDSKTRDEIAREVDPLLTDGIDPRQIAAGIKAWHSSDSWSPTQLRRFVTKAARPIDTDIDHKPTKATLRAVDTMTAAEQIIAEMREGIA